MMNDLHENNICLSFYLCLFLILHQIFLLFKHKGIDRDRAINFHE